MKTLISATILALALAVPAFAQDAKPAIPPAPATTQTAPVIAPKAAAPATPVAPVAAAPKAAAPVAAPAAKAVTPVKADAKAVVKLVNINTATPAELDALPKIGKARTKAIIAGRPYASVDDLIKKKVLPKDAFEAIKAKVDVK